MQEMTQNSKNVHFERDQVNERVQEQSHVILECQKNLCSAQKKNLIIKNADYVNKIKLLIVKNRRHEMSLPVFESAC